MRASLLLGGLGFIIEFVLGGLSVYGFLIAGNYALPFSFLIGVGSIYLGFSFLIGSFVVIAAALSGGEGGGAVMVAVGVIELLLWLVFVVGIFPPFAIVSFAEYGLPPLIVIWGGRYAMKEEMTY